MSERAGTLVDNGNVSNLQEAVELEENDSPPFGTTSGLLWRFLRWWHCTWAVSYHKGEFDGFGFGVVRGSTPCRLVSM
jgi:hypothetical protein